MSETDEKQKVLDLCQRWTQELPAELGQAVLKHLQPSIRLVPPEKTESHLPIGASRIGGAPDLPDGMEWPTFRGFAGKPNAEKWEKHIGAPIPFVAQIRLDEMAPHDTEGVLPSTGMLYFFYLEAHDAFGLFAEYGEVFQLIYATTTPSSLSRVSPPDSLPYKMRYTGYRVVPRREWTLPNPYDLLSPETPQEMIDGNLGFWDHSEELRVEQGFGPYFQPRHRLMGYPNLIQTFRLEPGVRLLVQFDSDYFMSSYPKTGMIWGDAGRVYVLIEDSHLAAKHLDLAWAYFECS